MSSKKLSKIGKYLGVGERIRKIRGHLSQTAFGKILGVTAAAVSRWESGRIPDEDLRKRIADFGNITDEYLLYGDGQQAARLSEHAPEIYDASPLPPLAEAALTVVIAAVEDYYARHRLKRRPIQKARLIIRLYQHYAETREKPDDILIKGNLPLAD